MKTLLAVGAATLLLSLGACGDDQEPIQIRGDVPSEAPGGGSGGDSGGGSGGGSASEVNPACEEVAAGIAAYNAGDFEETVRHFELAVPLAEEETTVNPSQDADDMLDAVQYYAELAPADYPAAAASSPEFATYKEITLRQCAPVGAGQPDGTEEPPGTLT